MLNIAIEYVSCYDVIDKLNKLSEVKKNNVSFHIYVLNSVLTCSIYSVEYVQR